MPAQGSLRKCQGFWKGTTRKDGFVLNLVLNVFQHRREMLAKGMEVIKETQEERTKRRGIGGDRQLLQELEEERAREDIETANKFLGKLAKGASGLERVLVKKKVRWNESVLVV